MSRSLTMVPVLVLVVSLLSGCGGEESALSAASPDDGVTEVSFDGTQCTVNPLTAPSGDRAFVLTNISDVPLDSNGFFVVKVPDGYTFQDLVDIQEENGGAPKAIPENLWYVTLDIQNEGISFSAPPDVDLGADQSVFMWTLTPGADAIELYVEGPPELQWLCGPIEVVVEG